MTANLKLVMVPKPVAERIMALLTLAGNVETPRDAANMWNLACQGTDEDRAEVVVALSVIARRFISSRDIQETAVNLAGRDDLTIVAL